MSASLDAAHDRLVYEVAAGYMQKGFEVQIKPEANSIPEFLRNFSPDLIVNMPEGKSVVVTVKFADRVHPADYWSNLKQAVESNPGWSSRLVIMNQREEELRSMQQPLLSLDEVEARLNAGQRLFDQNLLDSALMVIWPALEAVLREQARTEELPLPNESPAALITMLYSEGSLAWNDYETLMRLLPLYNQAIHGHQPDKLDKTVVEQAQTIAQHLIAQQRHARKAA